MGPSRALVLAAAVCALALFLTACLFSFSKPRHSVAPQQFPRPPSLSGQAVLYTVTPFTEGLFGQTVAWTLEAVRELELEGWSPQQLRYDIETKHYGPLCPSILRPAFDLDPSPDELRVPMGDNGGGPTVLLTCRESSFQIAHDLLFRFFSLPVLTEGSYAKCGPKALGLHFRGSDKTHDGLQTNPITQEEFLLLAEEYAARTRPEEIFVCSDEESFRARCAVRFSPLPVTMNQVQLPATDDKTPYWQNGATTGAARAASAVADVLSLSTCCWVLKGMSALSAYAKVFNPALEVRQVAASKCDWFPAGAMLPYSPDTERGREILQRTMVGHRYAEPR